MRNAGHVNKAPDYNSSNLPVKIFQRENWDDRGETCLTAMSEHSLESLSNDQGNVNEKGKKSNWFRLAKRASRFFVHFFVVIARPRRKIPNFTFFGGR